MSDRPNHSRATRRVGLRRISPSCQSFCLRLDSSIIDAGVGDVNQIERFYARNLPLSREMAINLQSFGSESLCNPR